MSQAALKAMVAKRKPEDIARFHWWAAGGPGLPLERDDPRRDAGGLRHAAAVRRAISPCSTPLWTMPSPQPGTTSGQAARPGLSSWMVRSRPTNARLEGGVCRRTMPQPLQQRPRCSAICFRRAPRTSRPRPRRRCRCACWPAPNFRSDIAAGRQIGRRVAALAIARGKSDGSDAVWRGSIPEGPGAWKGTNPIAAAAGTWQTWVLSSASELEAAGAAGCSNSEQVKAALAELKTFARTPRTNHRATFWEVNGGARAHTLWNELARAKLLENGTAPAASARVLAALNIALLDAGIACWDAKYAYWYIRPSQLDAELKPLFPPPNHPSYPAAHGCFSTAAAVVLAGASRTIATACWHWARRRPKPASGPASTTASTSMRGRRSAARSPRRPCSARSPHRCGERTNS